MEENKPSLLLHICCAGCGVYISGKLKADYDVTLFYYNPNIYLRSEYDLRLADAEKIACINGLPIIVGEYDHSAWLKKIAGHENDPERGERCFICYEMRMEATAALGKQNKFDFFTTALSMSPHKNAVMINNIGLRLSEKYGIGFLAGDFKKKDGFKNSTLLAKELDLYRQNYCGCEFSLRKPAHQDIS
jgi:predicted adenine nucleotide alpha hydrolase (AANH) superfamily ATPase